MWVQPKSQVVLSAFSTANQANNSLPTTPDPPPISSCIPAKMPPKPVDIPAFATTQLSLLKTELDAEVAETSSLVSSHSPAALQRGGLALTNLTVASQRTGFGGKTIVELCPDAATASATPGGDGTAGLPEHGIRPGDIVLMSEQPAGSAKKKELREIEKKGVTGVVTRVRKGDVGVALNEDREEAVPAGRVWIVKLADEVTYKR